MEKEACWDIQGCNQGPGTSDPCVVADFELADGYLGGINGSRACFYISKTSCFKDDIEMSVPEKLQTYCFECPVFLKIQQDEGLESNIYHYLKHLQGKLIKDGRYSELPVIQQGLFATKPQITK